MIAAAIPKNEEARLAAVAALNILDTPSEERFDRITRMAKRMFNVPVAVFSIIDSDRQWMKSADGLERAEVPRDISFCGHTILQPEILMVADTFKDERFVDNPFVEGEPYIRFYAGCPIRCIDGSALGSLCLVDYQPRTLTDEDIQDLKALGQTAENELAAIELAIMDELTQIHNRRGLNAIAPQALNFCLREQLAATLVYLDLDKFKPINDTHGHDEGDYVLKTFANDIKTNLRESDIVARIGGDEFVVLLMNTNENSANDFIKRFANTVAAHNQQAGKGYDIEFSFGMTEFDLDNPQTLDELLKITDEKMYQHKKR
ncbi:diguanylate cyclase [Paraferrimonas sp. SM1919]|uniref:GGDEF domain-containing protein n=1 Tax=Paraferrimonas sp. SM1919 TaxID=2662263 RepID=UPI0013D0568B|nr:sensor domain-containing diguanylate cyclase [Paraferrimonas sp. SM1919]